METKLPIHQQVSHACIHDCSRCHRMQYQGDTMFETYIRKLIEFPTDPNKPIDCKNTKVDLSSMFGGADFAPDTIEKKRPTLVSLHDNNNT